MSIPLTSLPPELYLTMAALNELSIPLLAKVAGEKANPLGKKAGSLN